MWELKCLFLSHILEWKKGPIEPNAINYAENEVLEKYSDEGNISNQTRSSYYPPFSEQSSEGQITKKMDSVGDYLPCH